MELLCANGLPEDAKEKVKFKNKGIVMVEELKTESVKKLIEGLHEKIIFGKKLYCNGLVPLTPQKVLTEPQIIIDGAKSLESNISVADPTVPQPTSFLNESESIANYVRRHSLSLIDRSPHKGSIAEELLNSPKPDLEKANLMLEDLKVMTERLSDFASCISSDVSCGGSDEDSTDQKDINNKDGFITLNEKKRNKKSKRKHRMTPDKEMFLKKPHLAQS